MRSALVSPLTRRFWVIVHRWAGLTIALFLTIAGVTGAMMPFEEALSYASKPGAAFVAPATPGAAPLDPVSIAERVEKATGAVVMYLPLEVPRDHVLRLFVAPSAHGPAPPFDMVWANPYDGTIRATLTWGGWHDGAQDIVPFLYSLHYGWVAGAWGMFAFGIAALIWTLDCFVGFALTLPPAARARPGGAAPGFRARWAPSWKIRRSGGHKLTFDLHRASGLWLWPLLFVFAWSGVALTLPQASQPVMKLLGASDLYMPPAQAKPVSAPAIGRRAAIAHGLAAMRAIGREKGFTIDRPTMLGYDPASGAYTLYAHTSLDAVDKDGRTVLWFDGGDGRVLHFADPIGRTGADRTMTWMTMLHMAEVFGLPYRIFVSLLGLAVTALSVTGVMIWMRKRSARLLSRGAMRRAA